MSARPVALTSCRRRIERLIEALIDLLDTADEDEGLIEALIDLIDAPDEDEQRMIAMCGEYLAAIRLYDTGVGPDEGNPLWERIESLDAALEAWEPQTFAGIVAAAGMVAALASTDPEACDPWGSSYTGHWPETVARAVLRMGAAEQVARP